MSEIITPDDVTTLVPSAAPEWHDLLIAAANSAAARKAPCLLDDTTPGITGLRAEAKLIILRAIERLTETKDWIRAETRGPFSLSYVTGGRGLLDTDDLSALAGLCSATSVGALPAGSFPRASDYDPLFARPRGWLR